MEPRTLLAFAPLGPEFRILPFPAGQPSVAADADGDFVAVASTGNAIVGQRYNAAGAALGEPFNVATATGFSVGSPSVAIDADGDFVVAWHTYGSVIPDTTVRFRRYNAAGLALGGETILPGYAAAGAPAVAVDEDGDFVVTWANFYSFGSLGANPPRLLAIRYNAAGAPQGDWFVVDPANSERFRPNLSVASDAHGDYVIAWQDTYQDGSGYGIYARRYDAAGVARGGEFRINTTTTGDQVDPSVSADADGDFVVTWSGNGPGDTDGVFGQRFNAAGAAQGGEFRVNTTTAGTQSSPSVAADVDGDFVVTWAGNGPGDADGVFAQRFDAAGAPGGVEFRVNTATAGPQQNPAIATDADGDLVAVWGTSPAGNPAYAQRYEQTLDTAGPAITDIQIGGHNPLTAPITSPVRQIMVNFSERVSSLGGAAGSDSVTNPANWRLLQDSTDISSSIKSITFSFNATTHKYEAVLDLSQRLLGGNYVLFALPTIRDLAANPLDGDANGSPGGVYAFGFENLFVNHPPTTIGIPSVAIAEDQEDAVINLFDAFSDDVDPDSALLYAVTLSGTPGLFTATRVDPAAGTLVLDLAPDANGEAQMVVRATDTMGQWTETAFTVTVLAVNDPPVNSVPGVQVAQPGQVVTFGRDFGNAILVSDVDGATVTVTVQTTSNLTFELTRTTGVAVEQDKGLLRISGGIRNVNLALDGLHVAQAEPKEEQVLLTLTTDDRGNAGLGGPLTDSDEIPIVFANAPLLLTVTDVTVAEGDAGTTNLTFLVRLSDRPTTPVSVHYATADGSATVAGDDYQPAQGQLDFSGVETEQKVTVAVNGDIDVEGNEQFFLNLSDATGALIGDGQGAGTITNDDAPRPPPVVTQVFVRGSGWTAAYKSFLQAQGMGDATFGYAVPAGAAQLNTLPWGNLNQISIRFNTDVLVLDQDLAVRGVRSAGYAVSALDYDDATHTATWTLAQPITNDKVMLDLNGGPDGIINFTGAALDGDWANGSQAYPSGDAAPGGSLRFRLNVLGGDVTRDGKVTLFDWLELRRRLARSLASPGPAGGALSYGAFYDPSGDGAVGTPDLLMVRRNYLRGLPTTEPAALAAPTSSLSSITRDVLGTARPPVVSTGS